MNHRECVLPILATIILSVFLFVAPAQSAILLSDTFNNGSECSTYSGSDYGVNKELNTGANRQAGSTIPGGIMTYTTYGGTGEGAGATRVYSGNIAGKALDFFSYGKTLGPYVVGTYDFQRDVVISALLDPTYSTYTDTNAWVAISARMTTKTPGAVNLTAQTGVTLKVKATGTFWVIVDNVTVFTGFVTNAATYPVKMTLQGNLLDVAINNIAIDLNGGSAGNSMTITGAAGTHNYIGLSCNSVSTGANVSTVDNLLIETPPVQLLPPDVAVTVNSVPVSDSQTLTILGHNPVNISTANSTGTIQNWSFTKGAATLTNTGAWSGESNSLYGGTLTYTGANANNSDSVSFLVVPEPATLALLAFGTVAMLRRKK